MSKCCLLHVLLFIIIFCKVELNKYPSHYFWRVISFGMYRLLFYCILFEFIQLHMYIHMVIMRNSTSDFLVCFSLVHIFFCSDRLQNGISDDESMLTNFGVCMQCSETVVDIYNNSYSVQCFVQLPSRAESSD